MTHPSNPDDLERQKSLENIKKSLGSAQVEERVAGLIQSLQFGTDGLDLFIQQALQDESEQVKQAAYWVLHGHQPYLAYPDEQHPTEFAFPTDTISSLASRCGNLSRKILAGGSWKIIRIWDLKTGDKLRTLDGHSDWVLSVAFSPNGKILASSSADRTLKLWNTTTGELLHTLQGHSSWVNAVAITPDGKTLVSASADRTIKLWNTTTGELIRTLEGHSGSVMSLAISPDGKIIASGSADQTIKLWYMNGSEAIATWKGHSDWVQAVAIAPNGKTFVSGSRDGEIRIWTTDETPQKVNSGIAEIVSSMNLSESGIHPILLVFGLTFLSTSGLSRLVVLLVKAINSEKNLKSKFAKFKCSEVIKKRQTLNIHGLVVSGNQPEVVWSGKNDFIQGWNFDLQKLTTDSDDFVGVLGIVLNPKRLVTGGNDWVKLWDLTTGQQLHQFEGRSRPQLKRWEIVGSSQIAIACGTQYHFNVKGTDQHGQDFPVSQVTWTATGGTIDDNGNFNAGQDSGEFKVKATVGNESKEISVILRKLTTLQVITCRKQVQFGEQIILKVAGLDQDANSMLMGELEPNAQSMPIGEIKWDIQGDIRIDPVGVFYAGNVDKKVYITVNAYAGHVEEEVSITAIVNGVSGSTSVRVIESARLNSLNISPTFVEITPGEQPKIQVEGLDQRGNKIATGPINWTASSGSIEGNRFICDPNAKGKITLTATATQTNISQSVDVIVRSVLRRLEIHPQQCTLEPNQSQDFEIKGFDQANESIEIDWTKIIWQKNGGRIERPKKFIAGHDEKGSFYVTATVEQYTAVGVEQYSATAHVTVSQVLRRLTIWPEQVRLEPYESCTFTVTGFDQQRKKIITLSEVQWQVTDGMIEKQGHNECKFTAGDNDGEVIITAIGRDCRVDACIFVKKIDKLILRASATDVEFGNPVKLTVRGLDNSGNPIEPRKIDWQIQGQGTIDEPNRIFYAGHVEEQVTIQAIAKGVSDSTTINVIPTARLTSLVILRYPVGDITPDDRPCFTVEGLDQRGNKIATGPISWSVSSGRMDDNRLIPDPNAKGKITVTATDTQTNIQGWVDVIVRSVLRRLEIHPQHCTLEPNQSQDFEIKGFDQANESIEIDWTKIIWQKNGGRIEGQKTFIAGHDEKGSFYVTATVEQYSATAHITISQVLRRLTIWPEQVRLEPYESCTFQVTGLDQHQQEIIDLPEVQWQATDGTLEKQGHNECKFTAGENGGEVRVTATAGNYNAVKIVRIGKLQTLNLAASPTTVEFGNPVNLTVIAFDNFGKSRELRQIDWTVEGQGTIDEPNRIFYAGHVEEEVTITAKFQGVSDFITINVIEPPRLTKLVISSSSGYQITPDDRPCFTVQGLDQRGQEIQIGPLEWSWTGCRMEGNMFIPDSNAKGTYTVRVTETQANLTEKVEVNVVSVLKRMEIHPQHSISLEPQEEKAFTVKGFDQTGSPIELKSIKWECSRGGTIDRNGVFIGNYNKKREVEVQATGTCGRRTLTKSVQVTLLPVLKTLKIQVQSPIKLKPEESYPFTVIGFDQYGDEIETEKIDWDSTGGEIDENGQFTGDRDAKGKFLVTATVTRETKSQQRLKIARLGLSLIVISWLVSLEWVQDLVREEFITQENDPNPDPELLIATDMIRLAQERLFKQIVRLLSGILRGVAQICLTQGIEIINDSVEVTVIPVLTVTGSDEQLNEIEIETNLQWESSPGGSIENGSFIERDNPCDVEVTALNEEISLSSKVTIEDDGYSSWDRIAEYLYPRGRQEEIRQLLLDFRWLQAKLDATNVKALLSDFQWIRGDESREALKLVEGAIRNSLHILEEDKTQLAGQLLGRLLWYVAKPLSRSPDVEAESSDIGQQLAQDSQGEGKTTIPELEQLLTEAKNYQGKPWFRPVIPCLTPAGGLLLRSLTGHSDWVYGVAITPDGKQAVSASRDKTLKLWDLARGEEVATLTGHSHSVYAVAITPDGKQVVSASGDKTLKLWDLATQKELATLTGHSDWVYAVAITPDSKQAVSASWDNTLKLWDLAKGEEVATLSGHNDWVNAVAITPDGKQAVSASWDNTLKLWDLATQKEVATLTGHNDSVKAVAITPDGKQAISASWDNTLKLWDLATQKEVATLTGHRHWVNGVAITPDGKQAVSASWHNTLKLWDLARGEELSTLTGHNHSVNAVAITPNGKQAVSASDDNTLKLWDLETASSAANLPRHSSWVSAVAITPDGKQAVSASSKDETLNLWDLETGSSVVTLSGDRSLVTTVAITPDGKQAVSASRDGTLHLWDLETRSSVVTLTGDRSWVTAVAITPDGKQAVSASRDGTLHLWDLETMSSLVTLYRYHFWVTAVAITPDGKQVFSAFWDGTLNLWDLETRSLVVTLTGDRSWVTAVAITPDGKQTVSVSRDGTLKLWDLATRKVVASFSCERKLLSCAVAPDGVTVVASEESGQVLFLRLEGV